MPHVAIVYKSHSQEAFKQASLLNKWLLGRKLESNLIKAGSHLPEDDTPQGKMDPKTDLVVVLGGDGTMLGAVRNLVEEGLENAPIVGVNLGGLGFLTALGPDELLPAMDRVLAGEYTAPPRLMLDARVERNGVALAQFTALNDVVINKSAQAPIVELSIVVDKRPLTTFRADGLIFCTPTGSTAYNLSAGGPICHPALDCIVVTPICSFALSNRPVLLEPDLVLSITLDHRSLDTSLTCDGQVGLDLEPGDKIYIQRAKKAVRIIHSPFKDYFEILRTKLRWG
ncbi:NAD(+)/NADH kinase [Dethiosulfatarculus sandiegensis]|uniref:NAD kinase n=1 Tax=Dethiosulfatarculus sandiegensis TaxID=1429043 RepID=A0A0D2HRM5_9BACT|nr:NAD(+)/NADH kinase [Dethiosulfatarculus sandiegensis]KIX13233.1 inorganic polyphosphate/ATP-NAD kinase [Dethiosulfatarculus sandiegensis]